MRKFTRLTSAWLCMEASKSFTEGSFGSTPGSCKGIFVTISLEAEKLQRDMLQFLNIEKKNGGEKLRLCTHTEARIEDTKD